MKAVSGPMIKQRASVKIDAKLSATSPDLISLSLFFFSIFCGPDQPRRFKLINGRVEINFSFARLYCTSSQMSRDYNCRVQLARFIRRGCERGHNSIRTALLGLCDPAVLKERHQSSKNPFIACIFISLPSSINYVSWPRHNRRQERNAWDRSWTRSRTAYSSDRCDFMCSTKTDTHKISGRVL